LPFACLYMYPLAHMLRSTGFRSSIATEWSTADFWSTYFFQPSESLVKLNSPGVTCDAAQQLRTVPRAATRRKRWMIRRTPARLAFTVRNLDLSDKLRYRGDPRLLLSLVRMLFDIS
jgi:hypothetical protein